MRKTLSALIAHIAVILAVIITLGTLGIIAAGVSSSGAENSRVS